VGYLKDTIKGFSWMGLLRGSTRLVGYIKLFILARLLLPEQFGIFGIASLVLAFLEIITETGINVFLIQENTDIKEYLNTAWVVSIFRGVFISLVLFFLSPFIAGFFNNPDAIFVLRLMAAVPLLRGFINPAIVKYQKELLFKKEFIYRISVYTIDAIVAVILAFITKSAASFVYGMIAGVIFEVIFTHLAVRVKINFEFISHKVKRVVNRGKWVMGSTLFNYLFEQGDDIVVGRVLNSTALGFYQMAYKITTLPISEVASVVTTVTFPVYVKISGDFKRLLKAYFKTLAAVSLLVIPFGLILLLFAEPLVRIFLGENWLSIIPVVRVMSFFGAVRAIAVSVHPLFLAIKKQQYVTYITLFSILGLGITIVPFVLKYGIVGAAYSATIGLLVSIPVTLFYLIKTIKNKG